MDREISVLIDSYNECFQNNAGGVKIKIEYFNKNISSYVKTKLFNKWEDNITDYDIIHVFKPGMQNFAEISLAKRNGLGVVVSAVIASESKKKIFAKKIFHKILRLSTPYSFIKGIFDMSDVIIAETIYEKDFIKYAYEIAEEKIAVIPNGISFNERNPNGINFTEVTGISEGFVLQVGRFDENKNQLSTIKAVSGTDIQVVFIGGPDKDDTSYYDQCVKNAGNNIHFLGWLDHEDPLLQAAYRSCHSFILPSYKEILGNALFEAASFGANIIATNVLPLKSWGIDDKCFAVDAHSVDDIKRKIMLSQSREKNDELSTFINSEFSWNKVAEEHFDIYKRILNEK